MLADTPLLNKYLNISWKIAKNLIWRFRGFYMEHLLKVTESKKEQDIDYKVIATIPKEIDRIYLAFHFY